MLLVTASSCAGPKGRAKYETPAYQVVLQEETLEVRDYPEIVVASAQMNDGRQNSAFMTLFRYISGSNEKDQKIEMTTPVFGTGNGEQKAMSFVVPAQVVATGVPAATDPSVSIGTRAAGRFAVYRYSGRWSEAREAEARDKLAAWINEKGWSAAGDYEKANYDPPFTLPSQRRNEVLIRISK